MTVVLEAPRPAPAARRDRLRGERGVLLLAVLLALALTALALLTRPGPGGRLEPDSYAPEGSRALAELLRDRGVAVQRVDTVEQALAGGTRTTLLLPYPDALTPRELARLERLPGELVAVGAGQEQVDALSLPVRVGGPVPVEPRRPACDLPAAVVAGDVELGGPSYRASEVEAVGCYASAGRATLLRLPDERATLLGDGTLFTNAELDERGSAALALGLLGTGDRVHWLVPRPDRPLDDSAQQPLDALLPPGVLLGATQLALAAVVLALWRARRLGPVVTEPLPVVVRAAEAVEGRSRLYRAAAARGRAAEALRAGARDRLVRRLGLPPDVGRSGVVDAVAARTGRDPATVDVVLYGSAPDSDGALVRLADELDDLTRAASS